MGQAQTKQCQNCNKEFTIAPEDFEFYEKIKVPPPTWCPECRLQRRLVFRNERTVYKRECDFCRAPTISMFSLGRPNPVYCTRCWWSDKWDAMKYGKDYDFSKPFFEQLFNLVNEVPWWHLQIINCLNCDYGNYVVDTKNCYLCFSNTCTEDSLYSYRLDRCRDSVDCSFLLNSELCYEAIDCADCYKLFFSRWCENCSDSVFLYDCRNCQNCFGCVGLRNKKYCVFNKQYIKEEYFKKIKELDIESYTSLIQHKQRFEAFRLKFPRRYTYIIKSVNVFGDRIKNAKNCLHCFDSFNVEDSKYILLGVAEAKDVYDMSFFKNSELSYEATSVIGNRNSFSMSITNAHDIQYSLNCHSSSHLFGCVGLRHKQYCILNKQYTKQEYEELVPKIIQHMNDMPYKDKKGRVYPVKSSRAGASPEAKQFNRVYKYGEFFPPELSPFAYNETIAQEYFPLAKEQAIEQGYQWKDPEEKDRPTPTIRAQDLPDHIKDVKDDITKEITECQHKGQCNEQCTLAFKVIPQELEFYRKLNLPLPRLCPNCRHYQRLKQRNPLKLWHRKCMCGGLTSIDGVYKNTVEHFHGHQPCPNEFETTYGPARPEIVYCEKCYQSEVV